MEAWGEGPTSGRLGCFERWWASGERWLAFPPGACDASGVGRCAAFRGECFRAALDADEHLAFHHEMHRLDPVLPGQVRPDSGLEVAPPSDDEPHPVQADRCDDEGPGGISHAGG